MKKIKKVGVRDKILLLAGALAPITFAAAITHVTTERTKPSRAVAGVALSGPVALDTLHSSAPTGPAK